MSLQAPKPLSSQVESVPLHCDREHLPGGSVPWLHTGRGHSRMLSASWYGDSQWEGCRWPGSLRDWYQDLTVIHGDPHIIIDFLWSQCHEIPRADSMFVPSQWEMELLCNNVSHWLGASLESGLHPSLIQSSNLHILQACLSGASFAYREYIKHQVDCDMDKKLHPHHVMGCDYSFMSWLPQ